MTEPRTAGLAPGWLSEAVAETTEQVTGLLRPKASELFADALWRRIKAKVDGTEAFMAHTCEVDEWLRSPEAEALDWCLTNLELPKGAPASDWKRLAEIRTFLAALRGESNG